MIGGIYCEIPLGEFYDKSIADSVRWRLRKYLGVTIKGMTNQELDDTIADTIYIEVNPMKKTLWILLPLLAVLLIIAVTACVLCGAFHHLGRGG